MRVRGGILGAFVGCVAVELLSERNPAKMSKAVRVHAYGGPEAMKVEDVPRPQPGAGEVLVRFHALGVNYIDTYFRSGAYPAPSLPFTPGNEGAGEVAGVGSGVSGFKDGDRVAFVGTLGCYAEYRLVPADRLVRLPKEVSYETAAAMMLKGLTAQYLLHRTYAVKKGDTILVHAAAGGVGLLLCQWGKLLGATVIGTAGTKEKAELAKRAGAEHVILYREEKFVERVKELTGGKLCAAVYDGVGKTTFMGSLDCLRPLGIVVSFGSSSGKVEPFDVGILAPKGSLFVTRPTLNTYAAAADDLQAMAKDLVGVVASGDVKISVNATVPLDDVVAVHRSLEARETTGSTVLTV